MRKILIAMDISENFLKAEPQPDKGKSELQPEAKVAPKPEVEPEPKPVAKKSQTVEKREDNHEH